MSSRAKPLNTEPQPERVTFTLVFTDIVDSTATKPRVGGDLAYFRKLLQPHNARLRYHLEQHSGREVKTIGDSFMIVFDKATDAVNFAVAVQQHFEHEPLVEKDVILTIRIGIHTGEALAYRDEISGRLDCSGNTVDCAARVEALADGGQVLISEDTYRDVRRMHGVRFHDWGEYPLKGFAHRPVIWEVLWEEKQPHRPPGSYWLPPQQLTKFIGRKRELLEVQQLVRKHQLVTLLGMGGIGKTRLALEVVFRLVEEMQGQIALVKLVDVPTLTGGTDNPELLISTVVSVLTRTLDLKPEPGNERNAVKSYLKVRPFLLILDNCETVLPAVGFLEELLRECPKVRLFVTSQHPLGIDGEQKFYLEPMDIPSPAIRHPSLDTFDSFLLFDDRARHQKSDWKQDTNLSIVADLLRLTDGIPLAIELVASWVGYRPIAALRDSLQANREEYMRRADVPEHLTENTDRRRHLSMQACLNWSFHLLSMDDQALFKCLSIFVGGFFPEAVEPVCSIPNPQLLLDSLFRRSLIKWQTVLEKQRYSMLPVVREYAEGKLGDEGEIYREKMATYFAQVTRECGEILQPGGALLKAKQLLLDASRDVLSVKAHELMGHALTYLEQERLNCMRSIEWAYRRGHWDLVTELNNGMVFFFNVRPYQSEWEQSCLMSLEAAEHSPDKSREAYALLILGNVYFKQSQWDKALKCDEKARKIYHELGNRQGEAASHEGIADVYYRQDHWEKARQMYQESLHIFRDLRDRQAEEKTLHGIGNTYSDQGKLEEARRYYEESLEICQELNDLDSKAQTLMSLGHIRFKCKEWAGALRFYNDALPIFRELGDTSREAPVLASLGNVHKEQSNWAEALFYYNQSLPVFQETGERQGEAIILGSLGSVFDAQGQIDEAMQHYQRALDIQREIGDRGGEGITLNNLGNLYLRPQTWLKAIDTLEQSRTVFSKLASPYEVVPLTVLWKACFIGGNWAKAWRYYLSLLRLRRRFRREGIQEGRGYR